jgi:hypothetical protein
MRSRSSRSSRLAVPDDYADRTANKLAVPPCLREAAGYKTAEGVQRSRQRDSMIW